MGICGMEISTSATLGLGEGDRSQKHKRSQSYSAFASCLSVVRTEGMIDVRHLSEVAWRFGPDNQTTSNL